MLQPRIFVAALYTLLSITSLALASSVARNPLRQLSQVSNPVIRTGNHQISAHSYFDLTFDAYGRHMRLKLEPNHDILSHSPHIQFLDQYGEVVRTEPLNRLEYKVFKGDAYWQNLDSTWSRIGWARVTFHEDGKHPLFEGAFTINHDHHHIQLASNFRSTKHELDPWPESRAAEHMIMFRDSDISEGEVHLELKRDAMYGDRMDMACQADSLEFNMDPEHPIYSGMTDLPSDMSHWSMSLNSIFGKRQLDNSPGFGNGAGVNLVSTIGQTAGCPTSRKIALVGVAYDCNYAKTFNGTDAIKRNIILQMNTASDLYERTFNISLGLANLTANDENCPVTAPASAQWNVACSDSVDIQDRLNMFSSWRGTRNDQNSHWTLLTNCPTGSAVGLAWLGQACIVNADARNSSSGSQTVSGANVVAKTSTEWQVIAHETGHTFGAVHDCTSQTCSDGTVTAQQCCPLSSGTCDAGERYIMNPSTAVGITSFSLCSIGNICSAMGRNSVKTSCFSNNKNVVLATGPVCGNGIVEPGEECDCGGTAGCGNNACCDGATCKLKNGAVCDGDDCCQNCQLAPSTQVCRPSSGVCDPEEKCTGTNSTCPTDVTAPDGQDCGKDTNGNGLQCASGHCTSRDQQCKTLMGSYTKGNDTYACTIDQFTCILSCGSPEFGSGNCYQLNQNFLDGTPCGGDGRCNNGACKGATFGGEMKLWIDDHKPLVIGIASAVGALLLLIILSAIWRRVRNRRYNKKLAATRQQQWAHTATPGGGGRGHRNGRYRHGAGGDSIPGSVQGGGIMGSGAMAPPSYSNDQYQHDGFYSSHSAPLNQGHAPPPMAYYGSGWNSDVYGNGGGGGGMMNQAWNSHAGSPGGGGSTGGGGGGYTGRSTRYM